MCRSRVSCHCHLLPHHLSLSLSPSLSVSRHPLLFRRTGRKQLSQVLAGKPPTQEQRFLIWCRKVKKSWIYISNDVQICHHALTHSNHSNLVCSSRAVSGTQHPSTTEQTPYAPKNNGRRVDEGTVPNIGESDKIIPKYEGSPSTVDNIHRYPNVKKSANRSLSGILVHFFFSWDCRGWCSP